MKMLGGPIVCRALKDEGVRLIFGIPGTHNIELYDAMIDTPELSPILVTDEQSASFMADGAARATGTLAAINIVPGAGLTHAMSGITEAFLDQVPMLVLACGLRHDTGNAFQLHDVDQAAIARPVCKQVFLAKTHQELYRVIRQACELACTAPSGPVMVEVPANLYILADDVSEEAFQFEQKEGTDLQLTPTDVAPIIEALNKSRSIAIYAGYGTHQASDDLVKLAEKLDAIVFTTFAGKGIFPEDHPRWAWNTMGAAAPGPIRELEKQFDCLLAIGCRFSEVATASYGFSPPERLIHIDIDPEVFNKNYRAQETLTADAHQALQALLASSELQAKPTNQARLDSLSEAHAEIRNEQEKSVAADSERVAPFLLFSALQKKFGPETVFVTDSGNGTFLAMEQLRLPRARSFLAPLDYSCMGYSVPAAIGAKLAAPERPVVALAGDGAFLMTGLELLTAHTYQAGAVVIVLNDGKLSQIAQFQKTLLSRETCTTLASLDFKSLAAALHVDYLEIEQNGNIAECLEEAQRLSQQGQPVLVNVAIDYETPTFFSKGVVKTNFLRFSWRDRLRLVGRVLKRKLLS